MLKDLDLRLPSYITVRTPTVDNVEWWTFGLPFHKVEEILRMGTTQPVRAICASPNPLGDLQNMNSNLTVHGRLDNTDQNHDPIIEASEMQEPDGLVDIGTMVGTTSGLRTSNILDFTALKSVLPTSMIQEGLSCPSVDSASTRESATPHYGQILFSLANNCAGLEDVDMKKVLGFLQRTARQGLIQLLRSDPKYSSRAIAQTIFKAAIELGDASLIDLLLNENSLGIDVNRSCCRIEGDRYTPIERASYLRHEEVINVLLEHKSDVNRTYSFMIRGALDRAIGPAKPYNRVNSRIFRRLLNAGADVSLYTMRILIEVQDSEFVGILMSENAHKNFAEWGRGGVFGDTILFLHHHIAMATIRVILDIGADLIPCDERHGGTRGFRAERVIDAAAQRGSSDMVELLLSSGAMLTSETLIFAVSSGNHRLMRMLLERRADVNSHPHGRNCSKLGFKTTAFAEAIRLQNPETIALLERYGTLRQGDNTQFLAAIVAASEVGNVTFIERLIQRGGQARAKEMGLALVVAIREGRDKAVTMLMDAGADINAKFPSFGSPLTEAIEQHNAGLVHLLLEAGALTNIWEEGALGLAVQWGDHSIVKSLILAGADVDLNNTFDKSPLTYAVERQVQELARLMLDAGADVNLECGNYLEVALRNGDVSMACYLLRRGADPHDTPELGKAMVESPVFLELVLEKHRMRYSDFPSKFGCNALIQAIKLGDKDTIRIMLERGLDANSLTMLDNYRDETCSPFGCAIINSTVDVIELFLQKGCNPNIIVYEASRCDDVGYRSTAFLLAISTRNVSTVMLLHRYRADVNFPAHTRVKRTPLQEAAAAGSTDIVELLIRLGAEVNAPASRRGGGTALQFAAIGGYIPIACRLLDLQAEVNAPASRFDGRMVLEGAAEHGRLDMVQVLLNAGAGNGGRDQDQFTSAIRLARDQNFDHIADFLEDYLQQNRQEDEPVMPAELFEDNFDMWNADGRIEGVDTDPSDGWMVENAF